MLPLLWALGGGGGGDKAEAVPRSWFYGLRNALKGTKLDELYHFSDPHLGVFWFDAICFSILASALLVTGAFLATRTWSKVPRGIQNVFEWAVQLLRGLVQGFIPGAQADKYVPYLGTVFLAIFTMNLMGLLPGGRSPTMTLSTTAALAITTFIMVQGYAVRATGVVAYAKHFMGEVLWLAPLMVVVEVVGELARPLSLSLRLYGNIFGEDNVIEELMHLGLGAYIPVQFPMLLFAIFTSFLQAFIFTTLSTIYIASKVVHEGGHGHEEGRGEDHSHAEPHAHGAHH
jgi:F-type H+-transporting ATPase subunit a